MFVSGGTYKAQAQPGGSYPETFYTGKSPLDNRLFRESSANKSCPPLTAFSACDEYASVGGVTQADLVAENKMEPVCDPILPLDQNQYSESHYAGPFCKSECGKLPVSEADVKKMQTGAYPNMSIPSVPGIQAVPGVSDNTESISMPSIAVIALLVLLLVFIARNTK